MANLNQTNIKGAKAYQRLNELSRNDEIKKYATLVKRIALHLKSRLPPQVDLDDLIQAGMLGLVDALQNFKAGQGAAFETYASIRIRGSMIDQLRQNDWTPRSVHLNARAIKDAKFKLEHELGRTPTDQELADELHIDINRYHQMVLDANTSQIIAIEDTGLTSDVISERPLSEVIGQTPDDKLYDDIYKKQFKDALAQAMANLPERQRILVSLYYDKELNLREIGVVLGISESRTCQLLANAVERLRVSLSDWSVAGKNVERVVLPASERLVEGARPLPRKKRESLLFAEIEEDYELKKHRREQAQIESYNKVNSKNITRVAINSDDDENDLDNIEQDINIDTSFDNSVDNFQTTRVRKPRKQHLLEEEDREQIVSEHREALDAVRPLVPKLKNVNVQVLKPKTNLFKHS